MTLIVGSVLGICTRGAQVLIWSYTVKASAVHYNVTALLVRGRSSSAQGRRGRYPTPVCVVCCRKAEHRRRAKHFTDRGGLSCLRPALFIVMRSVVLMGCISKKEEG